MAGKRSKAGYDGKIAGLYDLEDTIGQGHFAVVKLARHVFTGEKVAVKVIDKTKLDEVSRSHLFQEVRCMKLVQHPNVVRLYEVIDTQTKLYLILELGDGGDMYDYIMKHSGGLEEKLAKRYFRQIVEAISYCHKLHVVHRDLKPENVVFFEKLGLVKLTDFGFSNMFAPGKKLETSCGSLAYSAPEILLGDSYDAPAVDVWSLGVILFMLVVGVAPFQEANDSETLTMIMDCRYHVPSHISAACRELIGQMLQREPVNRATLAHIMAHPWLNDGDLTPVSTFLPLITKEMISEADHTYVVQKMVEGSIASREEILSSIEKDSYNHITATYYLLIERRLRKHHQHEHQLTTQQLQQPSSGILRKQSTPSPSKTAKPQLEPLMLSPRRTSASATVNWDGLLSPPPTQSVSFSDEISKQKELKKTKTAPVPAALPSPIISVSSPVEEPRGGAGACFVKRLTTSMTLDRRKTDKANSSTSRLGAISPMKLSPVFGKLKPDKPAAAEVGQPSSLMIHSVVMSKSDPGEDSQTLQKAEKPQRALKVSVLANFFEQKAKEGGRKGKGRKFNLGCMRARNRPTDVIQEIPGENVDAGSSQYVQSLVSPPGTHPSTSTSRQLQPSSSTEPVGGLMVPPGAARKCSLIKEESYDEYDDEEEDEYDMDAAVIKPVKSLESLDDFATNPHASVPLNVSSSASSSPDPVNPRRPLKSVCSSPQLLNQIHEENESEDEDEFDPLKIVPRRFGGSTSSHHHRENSSASPEILRKYEQRKKRRGACQRGTSCSSSDASDTDDTEGRSRKDKLRHRFIHRRDSSDHSSDTDGPGGSLGGNGRLQTSGGSNASQGSYSHSGSGGGGSGGGGGGGGGKSEKKEGSDKNQSNNKTNSSHHKNNRHCSSGFGGSKGSLTDTSLKILSRKLSDISTGVGALLTDCRGSDCDNDSSPHKTPSTPHSPDHNSSVCSGTLPQHSRNTSFRSNSSTPSRLRSDSALFVVSEAESHSIAVLHASPVQYLGRSSTEVCCVCGPSHCQSLEFSQICSCVSEGDSMPGEAKRQTQSKKVRASPCRSADLSCGALHCKPSSGRVSVVPVESKCCSVV